MSLRIITTALLLITFTGISKTAKSQYTYEFDKSIPVIKNGTSMQFPFAGGLNTPMFCEIDLDLDGKLDLLAFDRIGRRVIPLINKNIPNTVGYDYRPELIELLPEMNNFLMTADFNCDGKMDLLMGGNSLKTSGFALVLRLNTSNTSQLSFGPIDVLTFRKVNGTVDIPIHTITSNLPGVIDVDNDGDIDLVFFDQSEQQISYMKNLSMERSNSCGVEFEWRSRCWGNFLESGINDSIYLDTCRFTFSYDELSTKNSPIEQLKGNKHAGSTVTALDIDGNSSADLLIGDYGSDRVKLLMNSDSIFPYTNSHMFKDDALFPSYDIPIGGELFPAVYKVDLNNDNKKDLLISTNSTSIGEGVKAKNNIHFYKNSESSKFSLSKQTGFNYFYDNMLDFGRGAFPLLIDINKDGLLDLLVGNRGTLNPSNNEIEGNLAYLKNIGTSTSPKFELIDTNYLNLPSIPLNVNSNAPGIMLRPTAGDIDGDGDLDLLIGDSEGRLHLFKDNSTSGDANFILSEVNFQNIQQGNDLAPTLFDINKDGLLDLVVGSSPGVLSYYKNYGSASQAVYTLNLNSIVSIGGNKVELIFDDNASKQLVNGQDIRLFNAGSTGFGDGTVVTIESVDTMNNSIIGRLEFNIDSTYTDTNSNAFVDPSYYNWGTLRKSIFTPAKILSPHFYFQNDELNMILATDTDSLKFYRNINLQEDTFTVHDPFYTNMNYGLTLGLAIGDINGDNKVDLIIGNESGGLRYHEALFGIGLDEFTETNAGSNTLSIYPNPSSHELNIEAHDLKLKQLTIRDLQGKVFFHKNISSVKKFTLNIKDIPTGFYLVEVVTLNGKVYGEKLIKTDH